MRRSSRLVVVKCARKKARDYIRQIHRHHSPSVGDLFCLAVCEFETGKVRGVATIGRPVSRVLDDGWTVEVNRVATDGYHNACSALYGAAWRVSKAMGYRRIVTYTLKTECGASLRAVGWRREEIQDKRNDGWANRERRRKLALPSRVRWICGGENENPFRCPVWPKEKTPQLYLFADRRANE